MEQLLTLPPTFSWDENYGTPIAKFMRQWVDSINKGFPKKPQNLNVHEVKEKSYRVFVPVDFNGLFAPHEIAVPTYLGLSTHWLLEYVLCTWACLDSQIRQGLKTEIFESIVDDIAQYITDSMVVPNQNLMGILSHHSEHLVQMCVRIHAALCQTLNPIIDGGERYTLLAANVEQVCDKHIVVLLTYDDRYGGQDWQLTNVQPLSPHTEFVPILRKICSGEEVKPGETKVVLSESMSITRGVNGPPSYENTSRIELAIQNPPAIEYKDENGNVWMRELFFPTVTL